ncbi:MAG: SDR family oxidoreductase [Polyangiaceae bacterium]|nr:SDR family oxidoreductase [Polyangiaceae bacterium]
MSQGGSTKVVAITGASSGMGEAIARHLAASGARVALAARRTDRLERIVREGGPNARAYTVDVTKRAQVVDFVERTARDFGALDVLVNNAGLMSLAPLEQGKVDEWDRMIDINVKGLLYGIGAALPIFRRQRRGHFINVGSIVGHKVFTPAGVVYSATKFAVHAISEGLRVEVGGDIRVTTIAPGAVDTELTGGTNDPEIKKGLADLYKQAIPASAIARAVAYAIEQPPEVDINEIVIRPTLQAF